MRPFSYLLAVGLAVAAASAPAKADFEAAATLLGSSERPTPNNSPGIGYADVVYRAVADTLTYTVTFSGLTAPALVAHIHVGSIDQAGPVVLPFTHPGPPSATSGTFSGTLMNSDIINSATTGLTDIAQIAAQILAGNAYVNIHSSTYPGGEIRGQLGAVPEPGSIVLLTLGGAVTVGLAVRRRGGSRAASASRTPARP